MPGLNQKTIYSELNTVADPQGHLVLLLFLKPSYQTKIRKTLLSAWKDSLVIKQSSLDVPNVITKQLQCSNLSYMVKISTKVKFIIMVNVIFLEEP